MAWSQQASGAFAEDDSKLLGPSSPPETPWAHSGLLRVLSTVGLSALSAVCTKLT